MALRVHEGTTGPSAYVYPGAQGHESADAVGGEAGIRICEVT